MNEIILSPDQIAVLSSADGVVAVRRPDGGYLGWLLPQTALAIPSKYSFTPEEISAAEFQAAESKSWLTTAELLEQLRSLDSKQP